MTTIELIHYKKIVNLNAGFRVQGETFDGDAPP
jgi:hypothetical protein